MPIYLYNKIPYNAMKLTDSKIKTPQSYSLMEEVNGEMVLSVLKKSEKADDYIIRYYNPTDEAKDITLRTNVKEANIVNLNEKTIKEINVADNKIKTNIIPNQVKTIDLKHNNFNQIK